MKVLQFIAILLIAFYFVPAGAHLIELPGKITLEREAYLTVQQIYRGWALAGVPLIGAVLATAGLAVLSRSERLPFLFASASLALLVASLATFFIWIYPVNQATDNWSSTPDDWQALRARWEYAHAVNAMIILGALISSVLSALTWSGD